jgi:hypothetical protein
MSSVWRRVLYAGIALGLSALSVVIAFFYLLLGVWAVFGDGPWPRLLDGLTGEILLGAISCAIGIFVWWLLRRSTPPEP